MARLRPLWCLAALALVLVALAILRPVDHDESQYVASAVLSAHGLLPYRDYAYLQAPLQPFVFGGLADLAGIWAWPAIRVANALLGAAAVAGVYAAARTGGAARGAAMLACALFVACDAFLFSVGTARNDALPAALMAGALPLILRASGDQGTRITAMAAGLLLAGAAAAKVSYALPALAYGLYAMRHPRHLPGFVALGTLPAVALVGASVYGAPEAFRFGVFTFPAIAPDQYYTAIGKAWKLGLLAKALDTLKFLALGPALLALLLGTRFRWKAGNGRAIDWMLAGAVLAALLPTPTWRQYLLPVLPLLFVRVAIGFTLRPPGARARVALVVFACAGLAPSVAALAGGGTGMVAAMRQGAAIRAAMDRAGVSGPVATLSPQFLAATARLPDPRFAAGPFYYRSAGLLSEAEEARFHLVARGTVERQLALRPAAVLTGGEGAWTSGDDALDAGLERWAAAHGYARVDVAGTRFRLWVGR